MWLMQPQRNRQDEFPSLLLRWKSRDLFWMISSVSMIISSCPRFRMFFPNCLSPILDDFPIIVIISPHVESLESQDSQVAEKPFLSFSIIFYHFPVDLELPRSTVHNFYIFRSDSTEVAARVGPSGLGSASCHPRPSKWPHFRGRALVGHVPWYGDSGDSPAIKKT